MIAPATPSGANPAGLPPGLRPRRKILFASAHCIIDSSSGAAVATLDALEGLAAAGFACRAFCTSKLDFPGEVSLETILTDLGEPYQVRPSAAGAGRLPILSTRRHRVPVTIVRLESTRPVPQPAAEVRAVLAVFRESLEIDRPDVMLTYGGDAVTQGMIALAKRRGIPVVFAIHNFAYTGVEPFRGVDYCIVPSEFAGRYYREKLGLDCRVLPNPVDWDRVRVGGHQPRYVAFINPSPEKGAYPFVRIAHELGRRRPEIPSLVVESRGTRQTLAACGLDPAACGDVQIMANTTDPRRFWSLTKVVLMPSLWWENQPMVAIEAMINGIPVIGSDRGGIPEVLGEGGVLLPLPDRLTPATRFEPTAAEVEPWVEAIIRLWDDRAFYEEQSRRGRREALRWHPDRLRPLYAEFFSAVRLQPGPPIVGGDIADGAGESPGAEDLASASPEVVTPPSPGLRPPSPRRGEGESPAHSPAPWPGTSQRGEGIPGGLASIIVPCFNQRPFTQLCLKALYRHTRIPWELIVVDNGSTDDTAGYLAGARDLSPVPVTVIANTTNRGFPAAINQGLQAARGDYLVLLNNDAVVTDGWLEQLIALASAPVGLADDDAGGCVDRRTEPTSLPSPGGPVPTQGIGLVGPMSNYAAPPQLVEDVPYRDLDQMHAFAQQWRGRHRGKWFRASKLSGFCVLMKRVVYETIGGLDERFGPGLFDDDDLAERARRAGFELAVAHDLFIHHFGGRTFVGGGIDAEALLDENARRFADKWGRDVPQGRRVTLRAWSGEPALRSGARREFARQVDDVRTAASATETGRHEPGFREETPSEGPKNAEADGKAQRTVRVSLTMIVRDEEANLPHCLGSVRGIFDEIVVVDTGSADRTREIAREFGARLSEFAWVDDFAAARNAALANATGDYAFWLDADDVVDPPEREKLRAFLDGLRTEEPAGYVVRCACDPGPDGRGGETVVDHVRLFPIRAEVRWSYRVHEQIMPALRRAGIPVRWTDLIVRHTGYVDLALRARKLDRDARILSAELTDRPDDPFVLFNLGAIAIERRDWDGALGHLRRSLARSAPSDSITRKLFALIARSHQMLGDTAAALRVCAEGLSIDPDDAELWHRKAALHWHRGESDAAEQSWRRILTLRRPNQFCSIDQGIYGHATRRNLAVVLAERGDQAEAAELWRAVLVECPGDREALAMLRRINPRT